MKFKIHGLTFFAVSLFALLGLAFTSQAQPTPKKGPLGNIYICGGIGIDERAQMLKHVDKYNLLVEQVAPGSEYTANEEITITNKEGQVVIDVKCNAPILMTKLDPGWYRVEVNHEGRRQFQNAFVPEDARELAVFEWKDK